MAEPRAPSRFGFLHSVVADARAPLGRRNPMMTAPAEGASLYPSTAFPGTASDSPTPAAMRPDLSGNSGQPSDGAALGAVPPTGGIAATPAKAPAYEAVGHDRQAWPEVESKGKSETETGRVNRVPATPETVPVGIEGGPEPAGKRAQAYTRAGADARTGAHVAAAKIRVAGGKTAPDRGRGAPQNPPYEPLAPASDSREAEVTASIRETAEPDNRRAEPQPANRLEAKEPSRHAAGRPDRPSENTPGEPPVRKRFDFARLDDLLPPPETGPYPGRRNRQATSSEPEVHIGTVDVTVLAPEPPARPARPEKQRAAGPRTRAESLHYLRRF